MERPRLEREPVAVAGPSADLALGKDDGPDPSAPGRAGSGHSRVATAGVRGHGVPRGKPRG